MLNQIWNCIYRKGNYSNLRVLFSTYSLFLENYNIFHTNNYMWTYDRLIIIKDINSYLTKSNHSEHKAISIQYDYLNELKFYKF